MELWASLSLPVCVCLLSISITNLPFPSPFLSQSLSPSVSDPVPLYHYLSLSPFQPPSLSQSHNCLWLRLCNVCPCLFSSFSPSLSPSSSRSSSLYFLVRFLLSIFKSCLVDVWGGRFRWICWILWVGSSRLSRSYNTTH